MAPRWPTLAFCVVLGFPRDACGEGSVTLTQQNFDRRTRTGFWLLNFHAPWCAHCQQLAPTYEKVAHHYHIQQASADVHVAKIDATSEQGLATRFNINSYPTIILYDSSSGEAHAYRSARTFEDIVRFVEHHRSKTTTKPRSQAQAQEAGEKAVADKLSAIIRQMQSRVKELFTTLTVAQVGKTYLQLGLTLSGALFAVIAALAMYE